MGQKIVRLALGQSIPPARDPERGADLALSLLGKAAEAGAHWFLLPELFLGGYQLAATLPVSLPSDAPLLDRLTREAIHRGLGLQVGFIEGEDGRTYDSILNVTPSGRRTVYRKTHLFGPEKAAYQPGHELPVIAEPELTVAPLICYELEFPEPARLAACSGAQHILVSTANPEPYGEQQILFARTRALENRAFVAVCNRVGEESGFRFSGRSLVAGPSGEVIAQAGPAEETLLLADCDLNLIELARLDGDYLADRRPPLYTALVRERATTSPPR